MSALNARDQALLKLSLALMSDDLQNLQQQIRAAQAAGLSEAEQQAVITLVDQQGRRNLDRRLQHAQPTAPPMSSAASSPLAGLVTQASQGVLSSVPPAKIGAAMSLLMDLMSAPASSEQKPARTGPAADATQPPHRVSPLNPPE